MSAQLNKVFIIGNLTRDPELRYIPSGTAVCSFSVAVNRKYTSNGKQKEEVSFIKVQAWGKLAETSGEYLSKGSQVLVEGALKQERWEDEATGKMRDKTLVSALAVQFLSTKPKDEVTQQEVERDEVESIDVDQNLDEDIPF